ncbi:MAG: tRNA lysidine(34) synthetase TilS [Candidatus Methylomirabilis sp.]
MRDPLLHKVQQTIGRHQMLMPGHTVVLAVSGGVDSMVLWHLFMCLGPRYQLGLHVAHLDHGLRGAESVEAAKFVRRHCETRGVSATISALEGDALRDRRGGSLQDAARTLRYRFLERVADQQGATRIAMGHHRDDQAETVLMNLLRGSGTRGLGGIPPVRGRIIRPLIECPREEIEAYALSEGVPYVEDSSNRNPSYNRNRVRLELLPELAKRYNPRVAEALASAATILEAEDALLTAMTEERLPAVVISRAPRELVLSASRTAALPAALRRRILRRGAHLLRGDRPGLSFEETLALERLLLNEGARGAVEAAGGIRASKTGDHLLLSAGADIALNSAGPIPLDVPGQTDLPGFSLSLRAEIVERGTGDQPVNDPWSALLDAERAGGPLVVRGWTPGDRFVPLGMNGRKKLQDFFVDAKVSRRERWTVPLLVSGGEIAWVVGHRVDERFKVTDSTRRLLRVRAGLPGQEHGSGPVLR